jgi:hypothetical protein
MAKIVEEKAKMRPAPAPHCEKTPGRGTTPWRRVLTIKAPGPGLCIQIALYTHMINASSSFNKASALRGPTTTFPTSGHKIMIDTTGGSGAHM